MTPSAQFSKGVELIHFERLRQLEAKGHTAEHDDKHPPDTMALAGACYALPEFFREHDPYYSRGVGWARFKHPRWWPWSQGDWRPTPDDRVRELTKAGALIAAEIDRLLRAKEGR